MKVFVVLCLASVALAGGYDREMTEQWQKLKAMESCWGEENMKIYTVEVKKAIAKCGHEDAPELSLPPYRSSYRFVNTMVNKADEYEGMSGLFQWMLKALNEDRSSQNYQTGFSTYSNNDNTMSKMDTMRMMMQMMQQSNSNSDSMESFRNMFDNNNKGSNYRNTDRQNNPMSQFIEMFNSRSKRQADGAEIDLGDRLVERLNAQKMEMQEEIGNFTCVMKELNTLGPNNELDLPAMKEDLKAFTLPSEWFGKRYEAMVDACYELATNLPEGMTKDQEISGPTFGTLKMVEVETFLKCEEKGNVELCMNHDVKKKVETNFGPMEDILKETQLTETEFFPLVIQMLHGKEMDYLVGDM